jgi:tetratricopeptide (TPR) repeat protein
MILTQCAVCATELGLTLGKKCGRCSTRYCGPECQVQHWKEGGHDQLCKKIKKAGGAEQYNANQKYTAAVAVAAEACADDTKGQTCYICTQALHWKTKEGLVRMCACRGTAGFAHVSCLAEQAKILFQEAEENNLDWDVKNPRWVRWYTCSLCKQQYHGVVNCAMGWAVWKTYVGRSEWDEVQRLAMTALGNGLYNAKRFDEELVVREAELSILRRVGAPDAHMLAAGSNLANSHDALGRHEEAVNLYREVYSGRLKIHGEDHFDTLREANNYASSLNQHRRFGEAKALLRKTTPVARRVLGASHILTLRMGWIYAESLYGPYAFGDTGATLADLREAATMLEEVATTARRVLGGGHPTTAAIENDLQNLRAALAARDPQPIGA